MYKKLIRPFLLFCLFLILPCACITYYANHLITQKIVTNNKNFLNSTAANLDTAFSSASTQAMTLMQKNSADFYTLLKPSDSSPTDIELASYRFFNSLQQFDFYSDYFSEYFIYFKNSDQIFTSKGTFHSDTFFQDYRIFDDYDRDYFNQLMAGDYKNKLCPPTAVSSGDGSARNTVYSRCIPFAVNPSGYRASDAVFVFLFDEDKLNEIFDRLNTAKSCYLYLLDTDSGQILNQPDDQDYAAKLSLDSLAYSASDGEMTLSDHGHFRLFWKKSSVSQFLYLCLEPQLLITRQLQSFLLLTIFVVFLALAVMLGVYSFYTRKINHTLSDIFIRLKQTGGNAIPSDGSDMNLSFDSLKNAVELLCKNQETDRPSLVNSFFVRLLQDSLTSEEIASFQERFHLFPENSVFCISILKADKDQLASLSSETALLSGCLLPCPDSSLRILLSYADDTHTLRDILSEMDHQIAEELHGEYKCTRSDCFSDLSQTFEHYRLALNLLEKHSAKENLAVYTENDRSDRTMRLLPEHKKHLTVLMQSQEESLCGYVRTLLEDFRDKDITFSSYHSVVLEILFLVQEHIYDEAISFSSVFAMEEKDFQTSVEKILMPQNLEDFCLGICQNYEERKASSSQAKSSAQDTLLSYIDEHLSDINLTVLSDATGMNPNYLSQYFKKHFGITFLEYVNKQKVERAKELLTTTSLTCKAIGETLGYSNQNVFIRSFKKLEAITPNEYRRLHQDISL